MDSNPSSDTAQNKPNWLVIGIIALIAAVLLAVILGVFGDRQASAGSASISGHVDFNGIQPDPEAGNASGQILAREFGSNAEFTDTNASISVGDRVNWVWDGAEAGKTYEVKADIFYRDQFIKSSTTATVTSPATDVVLTFNITLEDLPDAVIEDVPVSISGTIGLNGYIPSGSTVSVLEKPIGSDAYTPAVTGLPAQDKVSYAWDEAQIGREYDLKSQLISGVQIIGESEAIRTVAPAEHEDMHIESTAPAPQPTPAQAQVKGEVKLNGAVVENSSILMLAKLPSETEYQGFDRIPAVNGVEWTFNGNTGQKYNITAALQVNEQNLSSGNVLNVTAPADSETITINTGVSLSPPSEQPQVSCGSEDSTGGFNASIRLAAIENAQQYFSTVGTSSGGDDIAKEQIPAQGSNSVDFSVYLQKDTDYFTRYAYSYCTDCNTSDRQNWSSWSLTTGFRCPN